MIDPEDLLDPGLNFTRPENQPYGARIPELALYQLVGFTLERVRETIDQPRNLVDELFAFYGPPVVAKIKAFFREHKNIQVSVNWPGEDVHFPLVCVVNQGEEEDPTFSFLGERTGIMRTGEVSGARQTIREQLGVPYRCSVEVVIGTTDPNLTMYLHHIVKYAFLSNKAKLSEVFDIHDLRVSGRDLQLDPRVFPSIGFFKAITLQFVTIFDFNLPEAAAAIVDVGLLVDALAGGVRAVTEVPSE